MRILEGFRPAPERLWIRYRPRRWPGAHGPWTDWIKAALGVPGRSGWEVPDRFERHPSDLVYLPPVEPGSAARREALAAACTAAGTPVLYQRLPGGEDRPPTGVAEVWDLLPLLLEEDRSDGWDLPAGAAAVWPLIGGLTDGDERIEAGLYRLGVAGVVVVQGVALELSAAVKRRLAEAADERAFDRLFHAPPPSERDFARRAAARGLGSFLERPLPAGPPRLVLRRKCAGELRLAAELCRRLERPEPETQRLLRAARWIDREDHDLGALVEANNLEIVDWIDEQGREVVEQIVAGGPSSLVEALLAEYAGPRVAGPDDPVDEVRTGSG